MGIVEDRSVVIDVKDGDEHGNNADITQGRGATSTSYSVCLQEANRRKT